VAAKWGAAVAALVLAGFAVPLPEKATRRSGPPKQVPSPVEMAQEGPTPSPVAKALAKPVVRDSKPASKPAATTEDPASKPARPAKPGLFGSIGSGWRSFKAGLSDRAAFSLSDDFRAGLGEWAGEGDWARSWAYDQAGFVRPGQLALLDQTTWLGDYEAAFVGQIDRKALGWVVRASDLRNYQAARLVIVEEGPLPKVMLERYAVLKGRAGAVQRTLLPFPVRNETSYHVVTQVRGDTYTVSVQDKVVATWSESRLASGGVGFFSGRGEMARVRWVQVRRNDDIVGKICALVARPGRGRDSGDNEEKSE
jgi:hypothetical protein